MTEMVSITFYGVGKHRKMSLSGKVDFLDP